LRFFRRFLFASSSEDELEDDDEEDDDEEELSDDELRFLFCGSTMPKNVLSENVSRCSRMN
jgi:hypothetical protein